MRELTEVEIKAAIRNIAKKYDNHRCAGCDRVVEANFEVIVCMASNNKTLCMYRTCGPACLIKLALTMDSAISQSTAQVGRIILAK